jgi:hypothetical protein
MIGSVLALTTKTGVILSFFDDWFLECFVDIGDDAFRLLWVFALLRCERLLGTY